MKTTEELQRKISFEDEDDDIFLFRLFCKLRLKEEYPEAINKKWYSEEQ